MLLFYLPGKRGLRDQAACAEVLQFFTSIFGAICTLRSCNLTTLHQAEQEVSTSRVCGTTWFTVRGKTFFLSNNAFNSHLSTFTLAANHHEAVSLLPRFLHSQARFLPNPPPETIPRRLPSPAASWVHVR